MAEKYLANVSNPEQVSEDLSREQPRGSVCCACLSQEEIHRIRTNPPRLMNAPEGAAYTGMSERNFRELGRRRILPSIRLGGRVLFRREALDAALERLEVKAI